MPDISMCANYSCSCKHDCYRYMAEPNPYRQSYADFAQNEDGSCDNFWPLSKASTKLRDYDEDDSI